MQIFEGIVVSTKMPKTAVVEVVYRRPHPVYGKITKRNKRFKVETGDVLVSIGDKVKIVQARPFSKEKHFKILEGSKDKKGGIKK